MPAWSSSRTISPARRSRRFRAPSPRRNACAPAASTTTSTMSATPRATTPSSRCSAISPSATISRSARSSSPGTWSPRNSACAKDRLTATVYIDDDEAFDLWKKIAGLPESRIVRIAGSDNFWAMGDTGPCGPCSEIFYDHGEEIPGGPPGSPDADGDRFIEIWNLVFMQFEQVSTDERIDLPKPVDRHRHGARAHRRRAAGRARQLRHRSLPDADRRGPRACRPPVERGEPGEPARHRRSSPRHELPDRRRRAAVERGPRLCAPPHHAPRHAPRASPRRRRAGDLPARADAGARDGPGLSGARPRRRPDHRDAAAGGGALPADAGARPDAARRGDRRARRRATSSTARPPSSSTTPTAFRST